jgi:hypothetical protein
MEVLRHCECFFLLYDDDGAKYYPWESNQQGRQRLSFLFLCQASVEESGERESEVKNSKNYIFIIYPEREREQRGIVVGT